MPRVVIPSNLDTRLYNTLRNMANELENAGSNIPLLKTLAQVRGIAEGTSAYLFEGGTLYRYNKVGGKLFREDVDESAVAASRTYSSTLGTLETMAIEVQDAPTIIEPAPTDTAVTVNTVDQIEDNVGPIRVTPIEVTQLLPNNIERTPVIEILDNGVVIQPIDEETYFNTITVIDLEIEDERVEKVRPSVTIAGPSTYREDQSFQIRIEFTASVNEFGTTKIRVIGGTLCDFTGTGAIYHVTVAPTGTDTINISILPNVVEDDAGSLNLASDELEVTFTDASRPSVYLSVPNTYTGTTGFEGSAYFSENVTGFAVGNITAVGATVGNLQVSPNNTFRYTYDIFPDGNGNRIALSIAENVAQDSNGNQNTASSTVYIATLPDAPQSVMTESGDGVITIRWQPPIDNNGSVITGYDVQIGTNNPITLSVSARDYTFRNLTNGTAYDVNVKTLNLVGSSNSVTRSATPVSSDTIRPRIELTAPPTHDGSDFAIAINATETVLNLIAGDLTVVNGTASNLQGDNSTYTCTITPIGTDPIQITVPENVAQDAANNGNFASDTVIVNHTDAAGLPDPPRDFRIDRTGYRFLYVVWQPPSNDGGTAIQDYEIKIDNGSYFSIGTRNTYIVRDLQNDITYTISIRSRNAVGYSAEVSVMGFPRTPPVTEPAIVPPLLIGFIENIIGNPDREADFWADQGIHATCAAVAVGSALVSLGVLDDPMQIVKDSTIIRDAQGDSLPETILDEDGNVVRNTPSFRVKGETLYARTGTPIAGTNRYTLGSIGWNSRRNISGTLSASLYTREERRVFGGWNVVNTMFRHYGASHHTGFAYDFIWLVRELEEGNKVIAYIDLSELWDGDIIFRAQNNVDGTFEAGNPSTASLITSREDHAVWITGIDVSDSANPVIIINNSAANSANSRISLQNFLASWEDAEFIYTASGSSLPRIGSFSGRAFNQEHRDLSRILRTISQLNSQLQITPFFEHRRDPATLQRLGIEDRYNTFVATVAREQQRIFESYGLDSNTIENVLDAIVHE